MVTRAFDYSSLNGSAKRIQGSVQRIKSLAAKAEELAQSSAQCMIAIGQELNLVKQMIPHGEWGTWLDTEFGWTSRTAQHYMAVARRFKNETVSFLSTTVLIYLSRDSVPDEAVDEAISRAESGERITKAKAKAIRDKHAPSNSPVNRIADKLPPVAAEPEPEPAAAEASQEWSRQSLCFAVPPFPPSKLDEILAQLRGLSAEEVKVVRAECDRMLGVPAATEPERLVVPAGSLIAFDPLDMKLPEKLDKPRGREAWKRWCQFNAKAGQPLDEMVAEAQIKQLNQRSLDAAVSAIDTAIANRSTVLPKSKDSRPRFTPPVVADVKAYVEQSGFKQVDPERFVSYYEQQGWKLANGNPMSDWKSAVRTWEGRKRDERDSVPKGSAAANGAYRKYEPEKDRSMPSASRRTVTNPKV